MNNYTVQFKYNGKEYSHQFLSDAIFKSTTEAFILREQAEIAAKEYIEANNLRTEGQIIEKLHLYEENGNLLFDADKYNNSNF